MYDVTVLVNDAQCQAALRESIPARGRRANYLAHLESLADTYQAKLIFYRPGGYVWDKATKREIKLTWVGQCDSELKTIETPLPLMRGHYLTGLHEFGHLVAGDGEGVAWRWAIEHSHYTLTGADIGHVINEVLTHPDFSTGEGISEAEVLLSWLEASYGIDARNRTSESKQ